MEVRSTRSTSPSCAAAPTEVGAWAKDHGFRLPPDAPEVLDFYAARSPIFLAAAFDGDAAAERGQNVGDGTPVHITIPTDNPWVPLRILALGKTGAERVEADVYLLTDQHAGPAAGARPASTACRSTTAQPGDESLLDDLRSDRGMEWVPDERVADQGRARCRRRRSSGSTSRSMRPRRRQPVPGRWPASTCPAPPTTFASDAAGRCCSRLAFSSAASAASCC